MLQRVILAEPAPKFDLSKAETYGELVYLSRNKINPFNIDGLIGLLKHRLKEIGFDPNKDYVCLTGSNLAVPVLIGVLASEYETFKLLMFHAGSSEYVVRVFDFGQQEVGCE